ncbi:MAG: cytochrome ubiquinol oxidase subunit I [Acidimicrobiia bacterium]
MGAVTLARWQFGITTVYHFFFVPVTIGMALLVAVLETAYVRTKKPVYLRMTKFWGKLFLINFALGVVTGIVQEFQFGMNWSSYSRFVGDIFGAPLAIEGLLAFFLESTFLGLWIFGWNRLSPRLHAATMWLVSIGTILSAFWILLANAWMQNPVGYAYNAETGRAELTSFLDLVSNKALWVEFPHVLFSALATAAALILGVAAWHLLRSHEKEFFAMSAKLSAAALLVGSLGVAFTGHLQGQVMVQVQPMKMAAAEALWQNEQPAGFSLFAIGDTQNSRNSFNITIPKALSLLAYNNLTSEVKGISDIQAQEEATYGAGNYIPNVFIAYWSFRLMIGFGFLMIAIALWALVRKRSMESRWFLKIALWGIALPFLANSLGWIFTEIGRQPWAVSGVLKTADGVSPTVSSGLVWTSMIGFTVIYGVLAAIEVYLMMKYAKAGPDEADGSGPSLAY